MLDFQAISMESYPLVQEYAYKYGDNSCQHSFVCWYSLSEKYGDQFAIQDGFLFILREKLCDAEYRTYLFPMGEGNLRNALDEIMADAHEKGKKVRFQTVTLEAMIRLHKEYVGLFEAKELRNYAEYLHLSTKLAELPGRKYASKRYDANIFRRTYAGHLEESLMTVKEIPEVLEFEELWLAKSVEDHDRESLLLEYNAIRKQLSHFEELGLSGVIVRIDGVMQGFVYGVPLSEECYDVLIEKGNRDYKDIYRILHQDIVKMCAMNYKYINREEDVGVPGLRKAKMSYFPDKLMIKFIVEEL